MGRPAAGGRSRGGRRPRPVSGFCHIMLDDILPYYTRCGTILYQIISYKDGTVASAVSWTAPPTTGHRRHGAGVCAGDTGSGARCASGPGLSQLQTAPASCPCASRSPSNCLTAHWRSLLDLSVESCAARGSSRRRRCGRRGWGWRPSGGERRSPPSACRCGDSAGFEARPKCSPPGPSGAAWKSLPRGRLGWAWTRHG